ncbi:MAG: hypothetical protein CBC48_10230 [bacterium TMED88]|nr:MAG: hypothetical protein CBC48_10230 [bacterium TMED88]
MKVHDVIDLLLPARCLGCSRLGKAKLCDGCQATAPWTLPSPIQQGETLCPSPCSTLLRFEGIAIDWIHRFKYPMRGIQGLDGPAWALGTYLAKQLGAQLKSLNPQPGDAVMPIPLHPRRLRARGFNPAALIARSAFSQHPVQIHYRDLVRSRETAPQAGLGSLARLQNIKGAFAFQPRRGSTPPTRVWLVDDVRTTGATLLEAEQALRGGGVGQVLCVALAQTPQAPGPNEPRSRESTALRARTEPPQSAR